MRPQTHRAALIMAAGKSTRMKSRLPKAVHPLCGRPVAMHVIQACRDAGLERVIVVVGHEADAVRQTLGEGVEYVTQDRQLGTGHAVMCAEQALQDFDGVLAVLPADTPLIRPESIARMVEDCESRGCAASLLTAEMQDPAMYGRIVRSPSGDVERIVEAKDAPPEILAIREICTSIYAFDARRLFPALRRLSPENRQQEYYLTDVIGIFRSEGWPVSATVVEDATEVMGINTRVELADATAVLRDRIRRRLMLDGVTMLDPASVHVDVDVEIGQDTVIYPGCVIEGRTRIGSGCVIGPHSHIVDSVLEDGVSFEASVAVEAEVGRGTRVGPYSRLRPGARLGENVIIGDFVEIKNSVIHEGVSIAHMTYIGDAEVGAHTNIGAGTITCNYDGRRKHRTVIGAGAFVGSHTTLNAPVTVGDGAFIGSGSVITKDVPPDALALGRAQQIIKEGWARRRREQSEE